MSCARICISSWLTRDRADRSARASCLLFQIAGVYNFRWTVAILRATHTYTSFGCGKGGNVTSAGWQVTLCDPMWHVSSRSGVATLRTAIHLLLTCCYLLTYSAGMLQLSVVWRPFVACRRCIETVKLPSN